MSWRVAFYREVDGSEPVAQFLLEAPLATRAKVAAAIALLAERGPALPFPYSSQMHGLLRELHTRHGKDRFRVLYFADGRRFFILLHALIKRTQSLPDADIRIAEERMKSHIPRLESRK